ncbi:DUF6603 domain-containing protein [Pengzhenrongella frigida]|uniref:DUF6603 domain-containing protein n=1 Tax=Pengzhenrongella frigida TaxID=1259133 RepID=UPI0013EDEF6D|nr:DUF6603 domain-containing protein [Cellulomonas sp. HLT2-17]
MAGPVRTYADAVAAALGGPGDPDLAQLQVAADGLDAALAAPATLDQAVAAWRTATEALRDRLVAFLLGQVPVPGLPELGSGQGWSGPEGVRLDVAFGPLGVHVASPALRVPDPRAAGAPQIVIGPLPPNTLSAHLDAGPVAGDGSLQVLPDGVNGALALHLGAIEVAALASLRRVGDQPSFAAVFAAGFTPGIQLGFGFQLARIGGVVGINRSVDVPALAAKLRDGSAGEALFPLDAGDSARRALGALETILVPRVGTSVAGPTLRLSWLEIAGQGFCSLDLAVLIELPGPQRIVIVGVARAGIPVLKLRVDVVGVIDFAQRLLSVDASLVDSGLLDIFTIYGDLAFRQSWGPQSYTVLSVGGFYPGFRPEPANIPALRRLGFHLDLPVPGIDVRAEGYLAVTSNTVQLGGYFEAGIDAAGCGAHGFLGVDAIVQFTPFHVHAEVTAGFEVEVFGLTFGGIRLDGTLDGPGPVTISGRLTVETFLHDFHFHETFTFGSSSSPPAVPPTRAADVLANEEVRPEALTAVGGPDREVVLAPLPVPAGLALVQPRGGVQWLQLRVPLTIPIDRLDGAPLGGTQRVTATVPQQTSEPTDLFAPGSFITLSQAEALNRPAFEQLPAGVVSAGGPDLTGTSRPQSTRAQVFRKVRGEVWLPLGLGGVALDLPGVLLAMLAARDASPALATTAALVTVAAETYATSDGTSYASATGAFQAARVSADPARFAVGAADLDAAVVLVGV